MCICKVEIELLQAFGFWFQGLGFRGFGVEPRPGV